MTAQVTEPNGSTMRIPSVIRRTAAAFPVRRIGNDYSDLQSDFMIPGSPIIAQIFAGISMFFPAGERFMIASGKSIEAQITDPKLLADLDMFVRQEAQHASEHTRANKHLAAAVGLDHEEMCREIVALWNFVENHGSPRVRAGFTAATEHFTAVVADVLLHDLEFCDSVTNEKSKQMLVWHAIEECEHKAVMFDAYKEVGGSEVERIAIMAMYTPPVMAAAMLPILRLILAHGLLLDAPAWLKAGRVLARTVPPMLVKYALYYRPGFHPDQLYTRDIEMYWRDRLGILHDHVQDA